MNTTRYTYDMKTLAIIAAIAAILLTLLLPVSARAKAQGDTIGAYTKETPTGASRADMADATSTQQTVLKTGAVQVKSASVKEADAQSARIAQLRELIRQLEALLKQLKAQSI